MGTHSLIPGDLNQCDQLARLFFNIWPFTTIKICNKNVSKFTKAGSKFSQIQNRPYNELPKSFKISPKSQNFVKFGHTGAFIEEIF